MAEQPFLSKRQRSIVKGYYANADAGLSQRLTELISDLALAETPKKADGLWAKAGEILAKSTVDPARARRIVEARDLEALARLAPTVKAAQKPGPQG